MQNGWRHVEDVSLPHVEHFEYWHRFDLGKDVYHRHDEARQ